MSGKLSGHLRSNIVGYIALFFALSTGSALAFSAAFSAGQASASPVSCGDTITTDTTLHHNLVNCPNNGIIIGADNITLDLNYHRSTATGLSGCRVRPPGGLRSGGRQYRSRRGHRGARLRARVRDRRGGRWRERQARHNRVLDISSSKNDFFGIGIFGVARSVIRNSSSSRNIPPEGDGIGVFGSTTSGSCTTRSGTTPGPGIHVADSNENLIKRNVFSRNSPANPRWRGTASRTQRIRRNRCARNSACVLVAPARET